MKKRQEAIAPHIVISFQMVDDEFRVALDIQVPDVVRTGSQPLEAGDEAEVLGDVARAVVPDVVSTLDDRPAVFVIEDDVPASALSGVRLTGPVEAKGGSSEVNHGNAINMQG